ncbi:TonB-dependent receptor [Parasphingopyxis algicola]|uniref:TonB-dependent receptor n=1 Tax=Parasphingopyxis algicola TaxID=2026624 RepID=UPI0015A45046|nr:TonB-dependent receptor [Parasphingopyxis algicola]QLC26048.1 TonB-dependent receptor [Parasphingopyxis algicola]
MTSRNKGLLLATTAGIAALALPGTASAQVAGEGAETGGNEPIIVMARRREEALQNAPVSVAVATAETIEQLNLQDLTDIANTTAGLTFDNEFGRDSNRPVIRGQANILGDSGVATFIDGIYITGSISDYNVDDIERLEVVKGPQSALYGRNTYSGAINIITRSPSDEFGGRMSLDASEDDRYEITGYIEGGLAEGLTAGAQVRYYDFGGEHENPNTGVTFGQEESLAFSGVIAYEPVGSPVRVRLRGYYSEVDDGQAALFSIPATANNCIFDNGALYGGGGRYFCGTLQPQPITADPSIQFAAGSPVGTFIDTLNLSSRIEFDLTDELTLVSLTGYNDRDTLFSIDADYSPAAFQTAVFTPGGFPAGAPIGFGPFGPIFPFGYVGATVDFTFQGLTDAHDISQELKLLYEGDRFRFLIGGYYFDQSINTQDVREVPANAAAQAGASFGAAFAQQAALCAANPICGSIAPFFGPSVPNSRDTSDTDIRNLAVYGSVGFDITDTLELTVEGRYASERIRFSAVDQNEGGPILAQSSGRETYNSFDPRITLSWQATPDNLFYAVFATGTKPGGFNGITAIAAGVPTFDQEDAISYEIGTKNTFGDFTFNFAAFLNEIDGYQLTQNVQSANNTVSAITNAGDARIMGFEIEAQVRPSPNWTFTANYTLLDPEFTEGFDENEGVLNDVRDNGLVDCSIGDQFPNQAGCQSLFGSIDGRQIPRTSRHTIFADVDYRIDLGSSGWEFFAGANISHRSRVFAQVHNLIDNGDTTLVNARLGFRNDNYRVHFYVNNLTNEDSSPLVLRYADANNSFRRNFVGALRRSRHFGVAVSAGF